jgi:hypothetical protein
MLQEFKRIRSLITDIHKRPVRRQRLDALQPQQTFPRLTLPLLSLRVFLSDLVAMMQNLIAQSQNIASFRIDGQTVLNNVASVISVADLSKFAQRFMLCIIHFRCVHQNSRFAFSSGDLRA